MTRQHAVVVGGTRGLGLCIVDRFLARGFEVTVLSRRPSDKHAEEPNVSHVAIDLERLSAFRELDAARFAAHRPIRYLVFAQRFRGQTDPWSGEIQVSLNATKILIEGLADFFSDSGDRSIAAVSSVYGEFVGGSQPVGYHVAKAGLNAMTRYYAWLLGKRGIRMNAVMPLTYVKDESRAFYATQHNLTDVYRRFVPLQRMGETTDSANAVDFLCSERASFITGQCLFVDGGVSIVWPEETARSIADV
jgi:NAD(P)-dependent dehydrogenase (short-subunit alcohol dehydrogenase family)